MSEIRISEVREYRNIRFSTENISEFYQFAADTYGWPTRLPVRTCLRSEDENWTWTTRWDSIREWMNEWESSRFLTVPWELVITLLFHEKNCSPNIHNEFILFFSYCAVLFSSWYLKGITLSPWGLKALGRTHLTLVLVCPGTIPGTIRKSINFVRWIVLSCAIL